MKILSVVGARPQFIKLAPFSREAKKNHDEIILHTGQHYDHIMSDGIFEELNIPRPDYNLEIGSGRHGEQTGQMLAEIEEVLLDKEPDVVVIFGDTNSTLAGALAAVKLGIPSIHIEAGLRSFNREMPEEINRIVSDHTCDYLFVPTQSGMDNLDKEGLADRAWKSGDIMVDTLKNSLKVALEKDILNKVGVEEDGYYLVTLHRPYNVDDPDSLQHILQQFGELSLDVLFPAHPRTQKIIEEHSLYLPDNIKLASPFGYFNFINLQYHSAKIITDSGGIQKEAYILSKPCLTLRPETEWTETVKTGWNKLIDADDPNFTETIEKFQPPEEQANIFGEDVAKRMVQKIEELIS